MSRTERRRLRKEFPQVLDVLDAAHAAVLCNKETKAAIRSHASRQSEDKFVEAEARAMDVLSDLVDGLDYPTV